MGKGFFWGILILLNTPLFSQYTEQINSNRPGMSIGAFSLGTGVIQFEAGGEFRSYKHKGYNNSTVNGMVGFFSVRWGFLKEQLELTYEGSYLIDKLTNKLIEPNLSYLRDDFFSNFMGVKYLVYDPFKKGVETDVYSWKANNSFRLRDLIPAVSVTLGANFNFKEADNTYPYGDIFNNLHRPGFFLNINRRGIVEPLISYRGTLATQSHFLGTWVFVTNLTYNRITSDYEEQSYILTLTHTFSPKWSVYLENHGTYSDIYSDQILRTGAAYLLNDDIQIEGTIGSNIKDSPSFFSFNAGISYRLDFHKDKNPEAIKEAKAADKTMKKEQRKLEKGARKATKSQKKGQRRARKN
jgi:hypothetical protein